MLTNKQTQKELKSRDVQIHTGLDFLLRRD